MYTHTTDEDRQDLGKEMATRRRSIAGPASSHTDLPLLGAAGHVGEGDIVVAHAA